MEKLSMILVFYSIAIALPSMMAYSEAKVTKLRFFVHDRGSGPNQTAYTVTQSNITSTSPTWFGLVVVIDDPLTVGPKAESKILGQAQGVIVFSDLKESAFHVSLTFVFTNGKYKGSTLNLLGRNNRSQKYRQIPIVGGTGAFELAQGIATATTYSENPATGYYVFEYNIVVTQY